MTAFLNSKDESYERLGSNKAPAYVSYGKENRSQLIRIPAASGEYKRAELRSPDPTLNPYLAFAIIINAALDGIQKGMKLPKPSNTNFFSASEKELANYKRLPTSLQEAKEIARSSSFIKKNLPKSILDVYLK